MKKISGLCLVFVTAFFSCAVPRVKTISPEGVPGTVPAYAANVPAENLPAGAGPEQGSAALPEKPVIPPLPEYIMGTGLVKPEGMAAFLLTVNSLADRAFVEDLALFYVEEAAGEGVNHDAAFAQMCLETGFLRFGGLVTPEMNNFCGLGATGPEQKGEIFPDPRTGVRAHIQHLKAYATDEPLKRELVDPRYFWVRYGSSPSIKGLSGTWARDKDYAAKISGILERLYIFSFGAASSASE